MTADTPTGHDPALEAWYQDFESASPRQRHQMLRDQLQSGSPQLTDDLLEYAVAAVNQMLTRHNLLDELSELGRLLAGKHPEITARIQPVLNMAALDQALFDGQAEPLPELIAGFTGYGGELPDELWMTLLDRLSFYGQTEVSDQLARALWERLAPTRGDEDVLLVSRLREQLLLSAIQTYWLSPQGEADKAAFDTVIASLGEQDPELLDIMYQQRDADSDTQLALVLEKFKKRATFSAVHNAQMAFARWALAEQGLNLYTSCEIASHAVMLWRMNADRDEPNLSLEQLVALTHDQLDEYFQALDEDTGLGLDGMVLFAWGMPLVLKWLHQLGLMPAEDLQGHAEVLSEMRTAIVEAAGTVLWSYGFARNWPGNRQEAALFEASRHSSVPLSDDPADSALYDEDDEISEEELMAFMSDQLAGLSSEQRGQVMAMLADEFGPEAGAQLEQLLGQQGGSGLILPASYRPGQS